MVQFDEANLSNSSLNNLALVNKGVVMKKQHFTALLHPFSTMTERSRSMIDAYHEPLIVIPRGRYSVSRTPSLSQKMIIIIFPVDLSWRSRVGVCSSGLFQILASSYLRIVVANPGLIAGYDAIKKLDQIYFSLLQELLTTIHKIGTLNWCQQFQYPPRTNVLHAQLIVHDLMDNGFGNG